MNHLNCDICSNGKLSKCFEIEVIQRKKINKLNTSEIYALRTFACVCVCAQFMLLLEQIGRCEINVDVARFFFAAAYSCVHQIDALQAESDRREI